MNNPSQLNKKFKQGYFTPYNINKYVGDVHNIKYRSGWERTFMIWCDRNLIIKRWSAEPFPIAYISPLDLKEHKYWVDFWVDLGDSKRRLIEVKPYAQTLKPIYKESERPGKEKRIENYIYEMKRYIVNIAKWKYAKAFCDSKGLIFTIVTERDLKLNS